jgi:multisubunit Na+/H+ antiporter MnhC subunit
MTTTLVRPTTAVRPTSTARTATVLTFVVVAAATIASIGGLAVHGLYTDDTTWATGALRGGDLATLVLVVPGLIATTLLARRGSVRARLVWGGLLGYGVYNFAFYVFGAAFNDLFLVHVVAFSASIFAVIAWAAELDAPAIAARFGPRTPRRSVAVLLVGVAAVFATLWTTFSLIYAVTGRLSLGAATLAGMHLVFALDLSLMVPSMAIGGLWLWRRRPWGYVLATALCVFGAAYQANLVAAGVFQSNADVAGAKVVDPMGAAVLLAFIVAGTAMLRRVR